MLERGTITQNRSKTMLAANYKPTLVCLMSFLYTQEYDKSHNFIDEQHTKRCTFGEKNPDDNANPILARSNTIKFWKKAFSFFIPNMFMVWNYVTNRDVREIGIIGSVLM